MYREIALNASLLVLTICVCIFATYHNGFHFRRGLNCLPFQRGYDTYPAFPLRRKAYNYGREAESHSARINAYNIYNYSNQLRTECRTTQFLFIQRIRERVLLKSTLYALINIFIYWIYYIYLNFHQTVQNCWTSVIKKE